MNLHDSQRNHEALDVLFRLRAWAVRVASRWTFTEPDPDGSIAVAMGGNYNDRLCHAYWQYWLGPDDNGWCDNDGDRHQCSAANSCSLTTATD